MIKYNKPCPIKYAGGGGVQPLFAPVAIGAASEILPWVLGALGITGVAAAQTSKNQRSITPSLTLPAMLHMMGLANSYAHLTSGALEAEKSEEKASGQTSALATPEPPKNDTNPEEKPKKKLDHRDPILKSIDEWKKVGRGAARVVTSPWTFGILSTTAGTGIGAYKALSDNKSSKSEALLYYELAKLNNDDVNLILLANALNKDSLEKLSGNSLNTGQILISPTAQKRLQDMYELRLDSAGKVR